MLHLSKRLPYWTSKKTNVALAPALQEDLNPLTPTQALLRRIQDQVSEDAAGSPATKESSPPWSRNYLNL